MGRLIDACEVVWKINHAIEQVGKASETAAGNEGFNETIKAYKDIRDAIMNAPTVEPERKTGKWMRHYCEDGNPDGWKCDRCNEWYYSGDKKPNFCPNCGAKMED